MKRSRWASLLLVACVGLSGQRADAMRTPLTDVRASITQPLQLTAATAAADVPADAWLVESIIPLGTTADGQPLALISLLVPNSSLDELPPASTRAGPYAAPKTHTRVFCIVQPPLGLDALVFKRGKAFWQIEKNWWGPNPTERMVEIGTLSDGQVHLSAAFGGGTLSMHELGVAASGTYVRDEAGESVMPGVTLDIQDDYIRYMLADVAKGRYASKSPVREFMAGALAKVVLEPTIAVGNMVSPGQPYRSAGEIVKFWGGDSINTESAAYSYGGGTAEFVEGAAIVYGGSKFLLNKLSTRSAIAQHGFLGGRPMSRAQWTALQNELKDMDAVLLSGRKTRAVLDEVGDQASYVAGPRQLRLRPDATYYEAFHELSHARLRHAIGYDRYMSLGQFAREKDVFSQIWRNRDMFSQDQMRHAVGYIQRLKLRRAAGLID